jgi:hypothetical protein
MATTAQDAAAGAYYGAPVTQPYMPGAGYYEPQHQGIDIGLPATAVVTIPQAGTYQESLSSPYLSVFQMANGLYEDFLHIVGFTFAPGQQVPAGSAIGYLDPRSNVSGLMVPDYGGVSTGPFSSSAPHLHVAEYSSASDAAQAYGGTSMDPITLFVGTVAGTPPPSGTPTPPPGGPAPGPAPTPGAGQLPASSGQNPPPPPPPDIWGPDVSLFGQDTGINVKKIGVELGAVALALILLIAGGVLLSGGGPVGRAAGAVGKVVA